jgi:hypothetical protein
MVMACSLPQKEKNKKQGGEAENRTTAMGFFHQASSYRSAGEALEKAKLRTTHPNSPIYFLFYHAVELYLKSFLRMHGHTVSDLSDKYGHKTCCLTDRAKQLGLRFADEDIEVFSLMSTTDAIIRSRYIEAGFFRWPRHEALDRTCGNLHKSIGAALRAAGIPVKA